MALEANRRCEDDQMIIRHRTDRQSIDEIISPQARVNIARHSPSRINLTVTEGDTTRSFAFLAGDEQTPVKISSGGDIPQLASILVADCSVHSEQMHEHHFWIGIRAKNPAHEIMIDITTDDEDGADIICLET